MGGWALGMSDASETCWKVLAATSIVPLLTKSMLEIVVEPAPPDLRKVPLLVMPPSVGGVKEVTTYIQLFDYDVNLLVNAAKDTAAAGR